MISLDRFLCEKFFPGVIFLDRRTVYVESFVNLEIGPGTVIEPFVKLSGKVKIGKNCRICFGFEGHDLECGDGCELAGKVYDSKFGKNCRIGKFAEIKRSDFGDGVNCVHHCYIGDAKIGNEVNIGAGVITANFDGLGKHKTIIESGAFIGTNVNLVAPIRIGKEALVAAGSTITKDVEPHALAVSRAQRIDKPNFWQKAGKYWQKIKP